MVGNHISIVEDCVKVLRYDALGKVIINTAQAGASLKIYDGSELVAAVDGNVPGSKDYDCKLSSGMLTLAVTGVSSFNATVVAYNL